MKYKIILFIQQFSNSFSNNFPIRQVEKEYEQTIYLACYLTVGNFQGK